MKDFQTFLINRLAHQVQNDLTTMRLALFNLNDMLHNVQTDSPTQQDPTDFVQAMAKSLEKSMGSLFKILMATRSGQAYFKSQNLLQILFDAVTRHKNHARFKIEIQKNTIPVSTDEQGLHLFFEVLMDALSASLTSAQDHIRVQLQEADVPCLDFTGLFHKDQIDEIFNTNVSELPGGRSVTPLLIKQLANYLKIELEWIRAEQGRSKIVVKFNQGNGE